MIRYIRRSDIVSSLNLKDISDSLLSRAMGKKEGIVVSCKSVDFLNTWLSTLVIEDGYIRLAIASAGKDYINKYPTTLIILD